MRSPKTLVAITAVAIGLLFAAIYALAGLLIGGSRSVASTLLGAAFSAVVFALVFWFGARAVERRHQRRLGMSGKLEPTIDNSPICVARDCAAPTSVEWAASAVQRRIASLRGRPERMTGPEDRIHIHASVGSRWALALFGIYISPGRRRLPMKLDVELRNGEHDGVVANIRTCSDTGWYFVRFPSFEAEYRRALEALATQMCGAVTENFPTARG